jgi:hypothetical protein
MPLFTRKGLLWKIPTSVLVTGAAATGIYLYDDKRRRRVTRLCYAGLRIANLVGTAGVMIGDYTYCLYYKYTKELEDLSQKQNMLKKLQKDQEGYMINYMKYYRANSSEAQAWLDKVNSNRKAMDALTEEITALYRKNRDLFYGELHRRNGIRLRDMCARNGGIYIKLGQHIAMLDHVIPREYQDSLFTLLANTPPSSYDSIERIFQEDFDKKPTEIFDSFESKPIASASLAQVYIAYKDGVKYAVKVQHEGLREGLDANLIVITAIVNFLSSRFREFNFNWLTKEMNYNIPLELDFLNEIKNIHMVTKEMSSFIEKGDLSVPKAMEKYSSERILTMTFEEGCHLNNMKEIESLGLSCLDVSTLVSYIFSEQIFRIGFVHCGKKLLSSFCLLYSSCLFLPLCDAFLVFLSFSFTTPKIPMKQIFWSESILSILINHKLFFSITVYIVD